MNILNKLRRKPRHFQAFTGLTPTKFDTLLAEFTPVYEAAMNQKYQKPGRLRQPGAGHPLQKSPPLQWQKRAQNVLPEHENSIGRAE